MEEARDPLEVAEAGAAAPPVAEPVVEVASAHDPILGARNRVLEAGPDRQWVKAGPGTAAGRPTPTGRGHGRPRGAEVGVDGTKTTTTALIEGGAVRVERAIAATVAAAGREVGAEGEERGFTAEHSIRHPSKPCSTLLFIPPRMFGVKSRCTISPLVSWAFPSIINPS